MAGYTPPVRTATLVFEDGDLKGLELEARLNVPFTTLWALIDAVSADVKKRTIPEVREVLTLFAEQCLIGWNLEQDGKPVPCTPEALLATFDPASAGAMLYRYIGAVGDLGAPLPRRRSGGRTSANARAKRRPRS